MTTTVLTIIVIILAGMMTGMIIGVKATGITTTINLIGAGKTNILIIKEMTMTVISVLTIVAEIMSVVNGNGNGRWKSERDRD
jgi:hypothetical protein